MFGERSGFKSHRVRACVGCACFVRPNYRPSQKKKIIIKKRYFFSLFHFLINNIYVFNLSLLIYQLKENVKIIIKGKIEGVLSYLNYLKRCKCIVSKKI